ncbi:MAG TPA: potassium channel family protein [Rhizomicrobium sp.]|nr:potassium channel family protein [Rhizomicrobium sp.]
MAVFRKIVALYERFKRALLDLLVALQFIYIATRMLAESDQGLILASKVFLVAFAMLTIFTNNRNLLDYVQAISAPNDEKHHRPTAIGCSLLVFIALIATYAASYLLFMPDELGKPTHGFDAPSDLHRAIAAMYFSTITISTLGYGDIQARGEFARILASVEALNGLMAFAVFTGAVTGFMATRAVNAAAALKDGLKENRDKSDGGG